MTAGIQEFNAKVEFWNETFGEPSALCCGEFFWDRVIAINLKGAYLCSKYAVPVMVRQGGGAIVNMSSVCGFAAASDEGSHHANEIHGPRLW